MEKFCAYLNCEGIMDEMVLQEDGTYHESCWDEMRGLEADYWRRQYQSGPYLVTEETYRVEKDFGVYEGSAKGFSLEGANV